MQMFSFSSAYSNMKLNTSHVLERVYSIICKYAFNRTHFKNVFCIYIIHTYINFQTIIYIRIWSKHQGNPRSKNVFIIIHLLIFYFIQLFRYAADLMPVNVYHGN